MEEGRKGRQLWTHFLPILPKRADFWSRNFASHHMYRVVGHSPWLGEDPQYVLWQPWKERDKGLHGYLWVLCKHL
jgi:hypothetical protein